MDDDPITGIRQLHHYDPVTEGFTVETQQDVTALADVNKALHADADTGWKGDWHRVASIPMSVYAELEAKGITRDPKAFKRWLNSSDNRVFRVRPGHV